MQRIQATTIQVTYNCPNNQNLYTLPVINNETWYDDSNMVGIVSHEVIFEIDCPCGERHEVTIPE